MNDETVRAAAADMLKALELFLKWADACEDESAGFYKRIEMCVEAEQAAKAAVAKAKGSEA